MHIIGLNTEIRTDSLQKEWLVNDLKAHSDYQLLVAGYHKPLIPHTQSKRENFHIYNNWAWIFHEYGIDLSLDGDSHMHKITYPVKPDSSEQAHMGFVRDDENGTMYIGEGSWGARPRDNNDDKPWTLTSGSFNQIKWVHVFPETDEVEAHLDIYTVISSEYDENGVQSFHYDIEELSEDNLFDIPEGIRLHQMEEYGNAVRYPIHLNK